MRGETGRRQRRGMLNSIGAAPSPPKQGTTAPSRPPPFALPLSLSKRQLANIYSQTRSISPPLQQEEQRGEEEKRKKEKTKRSLPKRKTQLRRRGQWSSTQIGQRSNKERLRIERKEKQGERDNLFKHRTANNSSLPYQEKGKASG